MLSSKQTAIYERIVAFADRHPSGFTRVDALVNGTMQPDTSLECAWTILENLVKAGRLRHEIAKTPTGKTSKRDTKFYPVKDIP